MNPHFGSLVMGLAAQANAALDGKLPPGTPGSAAGDARPLAQALIDTLAALEEKTRGNLTAEEGKLLSEVLTGLRIRFATSNAH